MNRVPMFHSMTSQSQARRPGRVHRPPPGDEREIQLLPDGAGQRIMLGCRFAGMAAAPLTNHRRDRVSSRSSRPFRGRVARSAFVDHLMPAAFQRRMFMAPAAPGGFETLIPPYRIAEMYRDKAGGLVKKGERGKDVRFTPNGDLLSPSCHGIWRFLSPQTSGVSACRP